MIEMAKKKEDQYSDFANVVAQNAFLTSQEFPEGPYGSPMGAENPVENKHTPWKDGQQYTSGFAYEFRRLHADIPRQYPGAHPTHADPSAESEPTSEEDTP
jgi:hypothetical protein